MKRQTILLLIFFFLFLGKYADAQDCPPGSVTITSQTQMNSFAAAYPNCTQINGNFTLGGDSYSSDIYPSLPALEKITGSLQFYANSNPNGFPNLDTIGGDLIFRQYQFDFSPLYVEITGLNQLKYIGGDFRLLGYENICAQDLSGLSQLNYIGGDFDFYWQYEGSGSGDGCLNGIDNINGLEQLKHVGGKLRISQSDLLNLDFLTPLESVGGNLEITANGLESIEGLNHAIIIGGELIIEDNPDLSECAVQTVCDHINSNGVTTIANNKVGCDNLEQVEASCNVDCSGDLILTTQQEVDDFMINYAGCFHIEGNLTINGITPDEISNLNGLSEVITISDTLFIIDNQMLTDISGLANVDYSSIGHIQISGNSILSSCSIASVCRFIANNGTNSIYNNNEDCNSETEIRNNCMICPSSYTILESQDEVDEYRILYTGCTDVPESIKVTGDDIDNLNGLIEIERMEKSLIIESCPALTDLSGLDNLESVSSLRIQWNSMLSNIHALSNLTTIENKFTLTSDVPLTGLENLEHMGTFKMFWNDLVTDFTVFSSLDSLRNIDLYSNDNLMSMDGLQNLTHLQNVDIAKHDNLVSLEGLNNIISVNNFTVAENSALQSFEGLNSLTYVTNDMNIGDYGGSNHGAAFQTLSGLDNLTTIDGDLMVAGTSQLNNLEGLNSLTSLGERLIIFGNSGLNNLSGLENLTTVGSHLIMKYNGLTSLEGLNNLQTINGDLMIGDDATGPGEAGNALEDISALSSLVSINGRLCIIGNDNLTTINNSLQNLDYNTITVLSINYNNNLSICNAQVICDYLNAGGANSIYYNDHGCNNVAEVESACEPLLPIEMTNPLRVHIKNKIALLEWRTTNETNNSGFEIQRSKDGINWEKIGWQDGQGTTTTPHTYMHRDTNPLSGTSYYRLKQVDFDGQFDYSNIVSLRYDKPEGITVYPIPAKDVVIFDVPNISVADEIILYDITGKQISRQAFPQDKQLAVSHLNDGVYIYRIFYKNEVYSGKIVVE